MSKDSRFQGKVAIITGAADGIGRATAIALSNEGASVVLVDIDKTKLEETKSIIKEAGGTTLIQFADVTKSEQVLGYVKAAVDTFGKIDIFFNNAGRIENPSPMVDFPEDLFDAIVAVNLRGVFLGMKYVLKVMHKQGSGSIINTGSMGSTGGIPYLSAYTACKHSVIGLTKVAALENARLGIRVNAVLPGNIRTKMAIGGGDVTLDDNFKQAASAVPMGYVGDPKDIADAVCFLASDEAKHITGIALPVDGGITAQVYPSSIIE